jgi:uroporphyrin-III C-methyltransferase
MGGKVYFVGAGPGAVDLLTVRAVELLQRAEVVLHDDLVPQETLNLLPRNIHVLNVGKRSGKRRVSQAVLNRLMVDSAQEGKIVVRLKGGDPSLFGRLSEEIETLRRAGIEFEIVPGVTAATAAAASAQMSLTRRGVASQLVFAPGTLAGGVRQDWAAIVRPDTTLVIYMPGSDYQTLVWDLMAAGVRPDMPCAVVSCAGRPEGVTCISTVSELCRHLPLAAPSVIIVGDVVSEAVEAATPVSYQLRAAIGSSGDLASLVAAEGATKTQDRRIES